MDLFLYFVSIYNTIFKILFLSATIYIIYLIKFAKPYCLGHDKNLDSFNHYIFIYPGALVVTILFHLSGGYYEYFEYFWSFSIWLEAVAIIPQLLVVYKKKEVEMITGTYMACLGLYRFFYVINWIFIYLEGENLLWIKLVAGIIQTGLYIDFLYYYYISAKNTSESVKLPV